MAQPTPYTPSTNFAGQEDAGAGGRSTVATALLDAEFAAVKTTLDDVLTQLAKIQDDDDSLVNGYVDPNALSTATVDYVAAQLGSGNNWIFLGAWANDTKYTLNDIVEDGGASYICLVAHTSVSAATDTSINTDLTAGNWGLLVASPSGSLPNQSGQAGKFLTTNGTTLSWAALSLSAYAALSGATFTGAISAPAVTSSSSLVVGGSLSASLGSSSITTTYTADFNSNYMQKVQVGTSNVTVSSSNRSAGRMLEILFIGDASNAKTLTWPAGWSWLGFTPPDIGIGAKAVLSLRCYGGADTDVVASWAET